MAKREIDLNRCLFHYTNVSCHRCEEICPHQAVKNREFDAALCDDCGLCTAVCPVGAIQSSIDYDACLTHTQTLEPQVLMCEKVSSKGMHCLGALNRRMLWGLAEKQPLSIDTSHCDTCRPAVAEWLRTEIAACSEVLVAEGKSSIRLVHVKETPKAAAPQVGRRSFFQSLLSATARGVSDFTESQTKRLYAFDPVIWLEKQALTACSLFPGLETSARCNACGLCVMLCPEKAITIATDNSGQKSLIFEPLKCTGCHLCIGNCPPKALTLLPQNRPQQASSAITESQSDAPSLSAPNASFTMRRG